MKLKYLFLIISIFYSCKSPDSSPLELDPRIFTENEIILSDIADDITYIPIANNFPIGLIYSFKIVNDLIYISSKDVGITVYDKNGKYVKKIGEIGRGPEEYLYCLSFTVDGELGSIYIMDKNNTLKEFSKNGKFIKSISLPECEDGFNFRDVDFFNSHLFVSQFINMGRARYYWVILDTLGNLIKSKRNSIMPFSSREGNFGGTYVLNNRIYYWNLYNDTVFSIDSDFKYSKSYLFTPGEHRMPILKEGYKSIGEFFAKWDHSLQPELILESTKYIFFTYYFNEKMTIALIDKKNKKSYLTFLEQEFNGLGSSYMGGINNNLDNGVQFQPKGYFEKDGREYLIGLAESHQVISIVENNMPNNSIPKYPEKRKDLEILASNLKETDNPVLMIVRLKK